jgi:hypothetical protein
MRKWRKVKRQLLRVIARGSYGKSLMKRHELVKRIQKNLWLKKGTLANVKETET